MWEAPSNVTVADERPDPHWRMKAVHQEADAMHERMLSLVDDIAMEQKAKRTELPSPEVSLGPCQFKPP
jgi:hypothetical protein